MGWPIVGDTIYGNAPRAGGPGLQLHAREIVVPLYKNTPPIRVVGARAAAHARAAAGVRLERRSASRLMDVGRRPRTQ